MEFIQKMTVIREISHVIPSIQKLDLKKLYKIAGIFN